MVAPNARKVVLVTGGSGEFCVIADAARGAERVTYTGLVGSALKWVIENEPVGSRFGKSAADEEWVFLGSKDGDLR
jgi:hypothetical protein